MMQIDAVESSDLLTWIMDRGSPVDMIIRIGPGKVLPITPSVIHMVLGLQKEVPPYLPIPEWKMLSFGSR